MKSELHLHNKKIFVENYMVERFNICTTKTWVYHASEITSVFPYGHSSISFQEDKDGTYKGKVYGLIYTRTLPEEINKIPVGEERFAKCDEYRKELENISYELIEKYFPEAKQGEKSSGEISLFANEPTTKEEYKTQIVFLEK